jgi:hypothetical protein
MPAREVNLPDFDDMLRLGEQIKNLMLEKGNIEFQIKSREAEIYRITSTDQQYFTNGKPPSAAYVKSAYEYSGIQGELLEPRKRLAEIIAELEFNEIRFNVMKMQVDIFRTDSANKRSAL